ncbi:hypothetical protein SF123566_9071 [Shigella flexneri 1235-66]|nr:hypothetical protein SF123566_9071 [Shigella flexneri 1235-66]
MPDAALPYPAYKADASSSSSGVSGAGRLFTACAQQPERTQST